MFNFGRGTWRSKSKHFEDKTSEFLENKDFLNFSNVTIFYTKLIGKNYILTGSLRQLLYIRSFICFLHFSGFASRCNVRIL